MEEGVYKYTHNDEKTSQTTFIKIKQIGMIRGEKEYSVERITFTFVNPRFIFPAFNERKYSDDEVFDYSPLSINHNTESELNTMREGGPMYLFYKDNYKKCDIPFRYIEHLYENFNSIKKTFKDIKYGLGSST